MNNKYWKIITILNIIFIVVAMFRIMSLNNLIGEMSNRLITMEHEHDNLLRHLEDDNHHHFNSITEYADAVYTINNLDIKNRKINLHIDVLTHEENIDTKASIIIDGVEYIMNKDVNHYSLDYPIDIFKRYEISYLKLMSEDTSKIQTLDWNIAASDEYLLNVSTYTLGRNKMECKDQCSYIIDEDVDIMIESLNEVDVVSVDVVATSNNQEIDRQSINQKRHDIESFEEIGYHFNGKYEIKTNDKLLFYIEVKDEYGLTYRSLINSLIFKDGEYDLVLSQKYDKYLNSHCYMICDDDEILYVADESLFN